MRLLTRVRSQLRYYVDGPGMIQQIYRTVSVSTITRPNLIRMIGVAGFTV